MWEEIRNLEVQDPPLTSIQRASTGPSNIIHFLPSLPLLKSVTQSRMIFESIPSFHSDDSRYSPYNSPCDKLFGFRRMHFTGRNGSSLSTTSSLCKVVRVFDRTWSEDRRFNAFILNSVVSYHNISHYVTLICVTLCIILHCIVFYYIIIPHTA